MVDINLCNGLTLAYIGDSVYELLIRKKLVLQGLSKGNALHKKAILYTCAKAQATIIRHFQNEGILSEIEMTMFKRGRNSHVNLTRKNICLADYLDATGFEALIGYLYLTNETKRIDELMEIVFTIL